MRRRATTTRKPVYTPSLIEQLPLEIQCEILKYPLTYYDLVSLRETSKNLKAAVDGCVEVIISPTDEVEIPITPQLVLSMERIKRIPHENPIVITDPQQLIAISQHKFLEMATFELTQVLDKPENIYTLVMDFFTNYVTLGPDCDQCGNDSPLYNFTFYNLHNNKLQVIGVYEGGLTLISTPNTPKLRAFLDFIQEHVPICRYNGSFWPRVGDALINNPCLNTITYRLPPRGYDTSTVLLPFLDNPNITQYYATYQSNLDFLYIVEVEKLIRTSTSNNKVFPHITTFLPVSVILLNKVITLFPNLVDIYLVINSFFDFQGNIFGNLYLDPGIFGQYQQIVIVDNKPDRNIVNYDNIVFLFPPDLRDRVVFISSE